ncbi:hypothetical protein C8R45DRAFT_177297 [Mycena sanguinolenta]|nr:hypothetical protein C8R45DRAFT_177297 [Mycena sanguinolenta]
MRKWLWSHRAAHARRATRWLPVALRKLSNGWIVDVDFAGLRDRILDSELPAAITELARDQEELEGCPIWSLFLDRISYKVHAFSRAPIGTFASAADQALRCGYYGPKGHAILISIIEESLEESIDPEQIYQTIATLKDKPEPWDQEDATFSLPSTPQFIYYVLAPFAATVLIAEDLDVDFDVALTIMQQSSDFGDLFNNKVAVVLDPPSKYSFNTKTIKSLMPMGKSPVPKKESLKAPPAAVSQFVTAAIASAY